MNSAVRAHLGQNDVAPNQLAGSGCATESDENLVRRLSTRGHRTRDGPVAKAVPDRSPSGGSTRGIEVPPKRRRTQRSGTGRAGAPGFQQLRQRG
jgi:hypothetical protein